MEPANQKAGHAYQERLRQHLGSQPRFLSRPVAVPLKWARPIALNQYPLGLMPVKRRRERPEYRAALTHPVQDRPYPQNAYLKQAVIE